mmetsp:Transcript_6641/g.11861  ORF Transcript_6641/g.11861 Transcript_6641/m.11861 type:complete len:80 (+) Transcript_6641:645-884(+)
MDETFSSTLPNQIQAILINKHNPSPPYNHKRQLSTSNQANRTAVSFKNLAEFWWVAAVAAGLTRVDAALTKAYEKIFEK